MCRWQETLGCAYMGWAGRTLTASVFGAPPHPWRDTAIYAGIAFALLAWASWREATEKRSHKAV